MAGQDRGVGDAGNNSDVGEDVAIVGGYLIGIFGARIRDREVEGEDVIGLDSEIDVGEIPEAVDGEAGTGQKGEREGEFADDENAAEEMLAGAGAGATALLEGLSGIDARCIPGGSETGEKAGQRGSGKSEEQDRDVEAQVGLGGQRVGRHGGDKPFQHGIADAHAECSTGEREQQALGEQLAEDGAAASAERAAHRQFLLAGHAASQQQIGDVDAGDEEHETDGAQQQPEHLDAVFGHVVVLERLHIGAPTLVAFGIHLGDVRSDCIHVLLRLLDGHARFKTAHDAEPVEVVVDLFRLEYKRNE